VCGELDESGDEPLMLARAVRGAVVCVCADRYLAGVLAERTFGATVHLLDDGFQHVGLARDLDVLVTTPGEIPGGRVLPWGRLREGREAAARAHVLVVMGATAGAAAAEGWTLGVGLACGAERVPGVPRLVPGAGDKAAGDAELASGSRVVVACGIANPQRFIDDVRESGFVVAGESVFADHHLYSSRDLEGLSRAMRQAAARAVLTTDKDAVRFEHAGPRSFSLYRMPMTLRFSPAAVLFDSVTAVLRGIGA
jgi:tetraacyldisaccharide 4'-kinase